MFNVMSHMSNMCSLQTCSTDAFNRIPKKYLFESVCTNKTKNNKLSESCETKSNFHENRLEILHYPPKSLHRPTRVSSRHTFLVQP